MKAIEEQQLLRSLRKIADNMERIAKSLDIIAGANKFESDRSKVINCKTCKNEKTDICTYCRHAMCWEQKEVNDGEQNSADEF